MKQFLFLLLSVPLSGLVSGQGGVYISPGASWVCVGSPLIVLKDVTEFVNKGTFVAGNSTVEIQEAPVQTAIGPKTGAVPLEFYNLTINSSKGVKLQQQISVANNINFVKGRLLLKTKTINLGTNGLVVGENENRRIIDDRPTPGQINITKNLGASPNINLGNLGVRVVSSAVAFGNTTVRRYAGVISVNGSSTGIIQRHYRITKDVNSGLNAKLNFHYLNNELNGVDPSTAVLWRSGDNGTSWTSVVPDLRDLNAKFLQKGNMNTFPALWTIGAPDGHRMPMIVDAFNVKGTEKGNALTWTAEEDTEIDHFILEKSLDGTNWSSIGKILAGDISYNFNDPFSGEAIYRLKQTDKNGNYTYSKEIRSEEAISNVSILLYPNPARNYFNINLNSTTEGKYTFNLLSSSGELVKSLPVTLNKGFNNVMMNIRGLAAGTYTLTMKQKGLDFSRRIVIQ